MLSVHAELKMLLEAPDEGLSTERLILKQRLASHGKALLTAVRGNPLIKMQGPHALSNYFLA